MQQQSLFDIEQTIKNSKLKGEKILTPNIKKMLKILASMGMDRKVFACLLELAEVDAQLIKYLAGPTITGGREWRDTIPSWVCNADFVNYASNNAQMVYVLRLNVRQFFAHQSIELVEYGKTLNKI